MGHRADALAHALLVAAMLSALPLAAQSRRSIDQLQHDIDAILGSPVLQRGFWASTSADGADVWYSRNADKLMMPASSEDQTRRRADRLGWDFRYETRVYAAGDSRGRASRRPDRRRLGRSQPRRLGRHRDAPLERLGDRAQGRRHLTMTAASSATTTFEDEGWAPAGRDDSPAGLPRARQRSSSTGQRAGAAGPGDAVGDRAPRRQTRAPSP